MKNASKDSCNETLSTNPQLVLCDQKGIINLTQIINDCKIDYNGTLTDIWPELYLNSVKGQCKFILLNDQSLQPNQIVNGQIVYSLPADIISSMCLNNCSNTNGICDSSGNCQCNPGYDGIDCSISLNTSPNITHNSFGNNMCDTRKENCYEMFFIGNGFSDSSNGDAVLDLKKYNPIKVFYFSI